MAIAFADVCIFLDNLEALEAAQPPLLLADKRDRVKSTTTAWFRAHRHKIDNLDEASAVALLSTLLPERRPDRVYGLQANSLSRVLSRALGLGAAQSRDLLAYKQPGRGDLASCLQRVLQKGGPPAVPKVTLNEVDELLDWLAGQSRFSSSALQDAAAASTEQRDRWLGDVLKRSSDRDAKWLVRLILKDLSPVDIDEYLVLKSFHFMLPDILRFQQDIPTAVRSLKTELKMYPSNPDPRSERLLKLNASTSLKPSINTKVSRPDFTKARSIDHCLQMLSKHSWVVERKYDGEYAEIHIDLTRSSRPVDCIKIFAKSGKDATQDRSGLHDTLVKCLRLGKPDCAIKQKAILLGEMVVWSDMTQTAMPFEEVRKHVTRSGVALGTAGDDRPQPFEHLCIVFFDILLLDGNTVMSQSIEKRRAILRTVYNKIPGRAKSAEWKMMDFAQEVSRRRLMEQFAASNAQRCEGLVFKPCGLPYYCIERDPGRTFHGYVKLKKDYIAGLGDEADLAVIGASYSAQEAAKSRLSNAKWTSFHLGALVNRSDVLRYSRRPSFRIIGTISQQHCVPPVVLETIHRIAPFNICTEIDDLDYDIAEPAGFSTFFKDPMVFEVLGSGYVKPSTCNYYMLRHPRVTKLHQDRSWRDCVDFDELQSLADEARTTDADSESQENRKHLTRLEATMKKRLAQQGTLSPSPRKRVSPAGADMTSHLSTSPLGRQALGEIAVNVKSMTPQETRTSPPGRKRKFGVDTASEGCLTLPTNTPALRLPSGASSLALLTRSVRKTKVWERARCASPCIMANAVIYLAPCIATTPYITQDMLSKHNSFVISSWQHWVRSERANDRDGTVVNESQAYNGLRRIMLVESKREKVVASTIDEYLQVCTSGTTPVEVWDWRVLESIADHTTIDTLLEQHLLGTMMLDDASGKLEFHA